MIGSDFGPESATLVIHSPSVGTEKNSVVLVSIRALVELRQTSVTRYVPWFGKWAFDIDHALSPHVPPLPVTSMPVVTCVLYDGNAIVRVGHAGGVHVEIAGVERPVTSWSPTRSCRWRMSP